MSKLQIGVLGAGRWGTNIINTLEKLPGVDTTWIEETAGGAMKRLPGRGEPSPQARNSVMATGPAALTDAVIIATPGTTHAELALPYLKAGIPVFIEKPMTTSLADAKKLVATAKKAKTFGMTGHIHLYNPAYLKLKKIIPPDGPARRDGGGVRGLLFESMNNGPVRDDMSALWDWAPHDIAMAIELLGLPTHVQAWGEEILRPGKNLHDSATVKLFFTKNQTATLHLSWLAPEKKKKLTVTTKQGWLIFDDTQTKKLKSVSQEGREKRIAHGGVSPLEAELKAFVKAVKTNQPPQSDLNFGLDVVSIIDKAEKSIRLDGKRIEC